MTGRSTDTSMKARRMADIFRAAADEVKWSNDYSPDVDVCVCMCDALCRHAKLDTEYPSVSGLLNSYFMDDAKLAGQEDYRWGRNFGETPEEVRKCREVSLLFLAAMVEAGDA